MVDIRVTFVLPDDAENESDASEVMIQAYDSCKQLVNNISWAREADLAAREFSKLDYLVFEHFEGKDFTMFIESKCAVVGPLAISVCLMECKPIPSFQWPILNVAMYGCDVTCSQLSKSGKEDIEKKVRLMGGLYTKQLTDTTTHLICDGTRSEKYMLAVQKGIKLMLPGWIDYLFESSQTNNISAGDSKILEKFKCPALHNLTICSTGITSHTDKKKLAEEIAANGGTLVAKLALSKTHVLICYGDAGTTSEKFKAARKTTHISCVNIDWVFDSIKHGCALPPEKYRVKTTTSTPTKEGENVDPNFSTISAIGGSLRNTTHANETVDATTLKGNDTHQMSTANIGQIRRGSGKRKADEDLVEKIDIKKVKNAGNFLDGCSIFVAGFSPSSRDKLNKIINISGATRYDDFSERVSHVLVGDPSCPEVTTIRTMGAICSLVSVQWLLDSVDQQKPAEEDNYLVVIGDLNGDMDQTNVNSPLSKKTLHFLKGSKAAGGTVDAEPNLQEADHDDPLTQKYLRNTTTDKEDEDTLAKLLDNQDNPMPSKLITKDDDGFNIRTPLTLKNQQNEIIEFRPHDTSTQVSQVTTDMSESEVDILPIFSGLKFILDVFDDETLESCKQCIVAAEGTIADKRFKGVCDYALFPVVSKLANLPPYKELVNELWLQKCIEDKSLCTDIKYFHRPIDLPGTNPLHSCIITISGYTGDERTFLRYVIEGLGGTFQEQFSRRTNKAKNVLASTHLVIPEGSGKKYEAAIKWNLPAVNKDWILECAKTGKKVLTESFIILNINESSVNDNTKTNSVSKNSSSSPEQRLNNAEVSRNSNEQKQAEVSTPSCKKTNNNGSSQTPVNQIIKFNNKDTPNPCSQVTPINKIVQDAINNKVLPTPPSPETRYPWNIKTPDTPLGTFVTPNPSPGLRKEMQRYVNSFPDFVPPKRRLSTPLSELKRRLMDKVLRRGEYSQADPGCQVTSQAVEYITNNPGEDPKKVATEEKRDTVENAAVHQKLQELRQKVMASGSSSATRRSSKAFCESDASSFPGIEKTNVDAHSQVFTVGWDYGEEKTQKPIQKKFMLSAIEPSLREKLANALISLGGTVSDKVNYDSTSTHLICPKPSRNEKTLACMASGKWILHVSYVEKSAAAGHFLDEEEFEFGNPKAQSNTFYEQKDSCVYFWRKEIKRRGYGAFNDMRAIVIAEKKEPIANVIEAGGGVVVNVMPPFEDSIHATHCLLEIKTVKDFSEYVVLAQQGVKCVNTIFINDFLSRTKKDDLDHIIPYFAKYYR